MKEKHKDKEKLKKTTINTTDFKTEISQIHVSDDRINQSIDIKIILKLFYIY